MRKTCSMSALATSETRSQSLQCPVRRSVRAEPQNIQSQAPHCGISSSAVSRAVATQSCFRTDTVQTIARQRLARQNAKSAGGTDYRGSPRGTQVLHAAGKMLPHDGTRSVPQHRECPTADDECTEKTTSTKSQNTTKTTPNRPRLLRVMWSLILDFAGTKHRLIIRHDDRDDPEAQLQTQLLTRALQEAGLIRRWSVTQQCQLNRCIHWFQLESRWSLSCTNSLLAAQKAIGKQLREMTRPNESNAFPKARQANQAHAIRIPGRDAEFQIVLTGADFHRLTWRWIIRRATPIVTPSLGIIFSPAPRLCLRPRESDCQGIPRSIGPPLQAHPSASSGQLSPRHLLR